MKTVELTRDFDFAVDRNVVVAYKAGQTYERVPEAQVEAILAAGAGWAVGGDVEATPVDDDSTSRRRKIG